MALRLTSVRLGTPRRRGEGLRIGTVRFLPRGVKKQDYARRDYFDVWLPILAPSQELVTGVRNGRITWARFARSYRAEMQKTDARQVIELLAALAMTTPIAVGCYCENEGSCHRSVLVELIRAAARA